MWEGSRVDDMLRESSWFERNMYGVSACMELYRIEVGLYGRACADTTAMRPARTLTWLLILKAEIVGIGTMYLLIHIIESSASAEHSSYTSLPLPFFVLEMQLSVKIIKKEARRATSRTV